MIGFFASNLDIRVGSYRIWVNDLKNYFNEIGITTKIFNNLYEVGNFETVIYLVITQKIKATLLLLAQ